MVITFEKPWQL